MLNGEGAMGKAARQRMRLKRRLLMLTTFLLMMCITAFLCMKAVIEPNIEDVSRMRAEVLVSRTVNRALTDQFQQEEIPEELFIISRDENGKTALVQANSIEINILMTRLVANLQEAFRNMEKEPLDVPVGAFLGSKLLSQTGPAVELYITPVSVLSTDFRTEFESQGINQTKYKIYIVLECRVKVLAPFSSRSFNTSTDVLIAETVILGEVPGSYVQVPKEDILDVTDE